MAERAERDFGYFTLVFKGDLREMELNPFKIETPYGLPVAASMGDALDEIEALIAQIESLSSR
jgi:hypothetical protein